MPINAILVTNYIDTSAQAQKTPSQSTMEKDKPPATERETEETFKSAILPSFSAVSVNISNSSESSSRNVMVKFTITLPFLQRFKKMQSI